ncbi:DNA repair protein RecO [Silvimonas iriomotensis]|uniref:DNA repair protein RecO n=1 Tax=Silvimonas iriomotensis TaxID=449662 RepID=A0ABQ2P768_9NEIS|nr:DNA repair protein RecO [Silvimonas iriomotensis]GGP19820.1 DNA repair protein RecO [Silvimonas iriomotensis]
MSRTRGGKGQPRVDTQPVFILHQYAWRETSRLIEVFSRDYGRVSIAARGVQRPGSQLRGTLLAFQPLLMSWFGGADVKTLHAAEWQGGMTQPAGLSLLCGFYLNELLVRLMPREEPQPALFAAYFEAIRDLTSLPVEAGSAVEPILRGFELKLLTELGYGVDLAHDIAGRNIEADQQYDFVAGQGLLLADSGRGRFDGAVLQELAAGRLADERVLAQGKLLMRQALTVALGDAPLHTRQLLLDLQRI